MIVSDAMPHGISHSAKTHSVGAVAAPRHVIAKATQPKKM